MAIGRDTRVIRTSDIHHAELAPDQLALLSAARGEYYGVEGPAAKIWQLLESERSVEEICLEITKVYDVAQDVCLTDTIAFVAELVSEDLAKIVT